MGVSKSQPLLQQQLYKAIEARSVTDLKTLVDNPKCDLNAPIWSPLFDKPSNGVPKIMPIRFAMEMSENIPILHSRISDDEVQQEVKQCNDNKEEMVTLLLSSGRININAKDKDGRTALHYAAIHQCIEAATMLIADPICDLNAADTIDRYTPIHLAAAASSIRKHLSSPTPSVFDQLLAHSGGRCNVNAISGKTMWTILHFAFSSASREEIVDAILGNKDFTLWNAKTVKNRTALSLFLRSYTSDALVTKMLQSQKFDLTEIDEYGSTFLHLAVETHREAHTNSKFHRANAISALLKSPHSSSFVNARNAKGIPPLHWAILSQLGPNNTYSAVSALLGHPDCDVNIEAGSEYMDSVMRTPTENDPQKKTKWSGTALHLAVCQGLVNVVKLLIDSGCDRCAFDSLGNTVFHLININQRDPNSFQTETSVLGMFGLLLPCVPQGFGTRNNFNQTPLLSILSRSLPSSAAAMAVLFKQFLELGEDVNAVDNKGRSVMNCLLNSQIENNELLSLCTLLFDAGANPSLLDLQSTKNNVFRRIVLFRLYFLAQGLQYTSPEHDTEEQLTALDLRYLGT